MVTKARIAFLGAGNMASSLIAGLIKDNYPPSQLWIADLDNEKCDHLAQLYDVHIADSVEQAVEHADIVVLAVKPQHIKTLGASVGKLITQKKPLLISIAAGVPLAYLEHLFGQHTAIVRAMPNTPALIQCGASGLFANANVSSEQRNLAEAILRATGVIVWAKKESLIDAITALSGSGPAYVFLMMEIMENIGVELGISDKQAHLLTLQTFYGAAKLALESPDELKTLRERVTSKGGTTEAALKVFTQSNLRKIFAEAMTAAHDRSITLSESFTDIKRLHDKREDHND